MLGAVLSWAHDEDSFVSVSNLARGTPDHEAWEMTKWFDTNYHYVVPELTDQPTKLTPLPWREPVNGTTWVVLGPFSLVKLRGRRRPGCHRPERRPCPLGVGGEVHRRVRCNSTSRGWGWSSTTPIAILEAAYGELPQSLRPLVTVQPVSADAAAAALLGDAGAIVQTEPERVSEQPWQGRDRMLGDGWTAGASGRTRMSRWLPRWRTPRPRRAGGSPTSLCPP